MNFSHYRETVLSYHKMLGGTKYPNDTTDRLIRFQDELKEKREYNKFTTFKSNVDAMVVIRKCRIFSFCEHHLLPFYGYASIAYIPDGKILGLSKFQRIVDKFASRPTLQENLTQEIADFIDMILKPRGVAVATNCQHSCMFGRGIQNTDSFVNVQSLLGLFQNPDVKSEFLNRIGRDFN